MSNPIYGATKLTTDDLTDDELYAIHSAVENGSDVRSVPGYRKCRELFTQDDGKIMHGETKAALDRIVAERLKR